MATSYDTYLEQQKKYAHMYDPNWWAEQIRRGRQQYLHSEERKQKRHDVLEQAIQQAITATIRLSVIALEYEDAEGQMYPSNTIPRLPQAYKGESEPLYFSVGKRNLAKVEEKS